MIDATGYRTETVLTLRGDVVGIKNANDEKVTFEIDALGRKTAAIDAKGYRSEFTYDENGNLTCTIDANAQAGLQAKNSQTPACSESRQYDELNRVTKVIDALNGETSFTYDLLGNRLTVKDAENKTWSFAYDDLGRLSSETDHSTRAISYKSDEAGNIYEKTNRLSEVSRYSFDNGNRLTRVDYLKDSTFETFGYDPASNRNAAANGNVSYTFTWDSLNRLQRKDDSRGRFLAFTFDKVGNILTKTTYQGSTTSYVYNAANRLVMLRNPDYTQVDYQYDPAGRLLSRVTANGARLSQQFDANGWMTQLSQYDAANNLVSQTSYGRDRVGNITSQTDASGASSYTLDALYRLTQANLPGTANDELFSYDKVGNRKTYTKGSLTANASTRHYNYTAGTNRLADIRIGSASGTVESSFTNDFEGRLTAQTGIGAKTLTWDAKGRVKSVGAETYSYDPMDYRIGRSGGSLGNRSYFLEGEHLESEYSGAQLQAKYFRGSSVDELVAAWMYDTDSKLKPFLFHHDQITSVTAISGHNGGTTQSVKYDAFGAVQSSTGSSPNRLRYTGREDDGIGLMQYRARSYDPAIGRFISEDPKGFEAGDINFYAYVGNNSYNANDPMGLEVSGVYYQSTGRLSITDSKNGRSASVNAVSGGKPFGDPIDVGRYEILERAGRPGFYRLDAVDASPRNDINDATGRDSFRLHVPGRTIGCISVCTNNEWTAVDNVIKNTSTVKVQDNFKPWWDIAGVTNAGSITKYGTLTVVPNNLPSLKIPSATPSFMGPIQPQQSFRLDNRLSTVGAAGGGYLLYPNKSNSNSMISVYRK